MAIDSREKRASALATGLHSRIALPLPDAAINQGDRLQVAAFYRGIMPVDDFPDFRATVSDTVQPTATVSM